MNCSTFFSRSCQTLYPAIVVKFLPSINISYGLAEAEANFQLFSDLRKAYPDIVKGLDLSGDPEKGKFATVKNVFQRARDEGFRLALHCGEINDSAEIREMIEFMTPEDRIGHGTFIDGKQLFILFLYQFQVPF